MEYCSAVWDPYQEEDTENPGKGSTKSCVLRKRGLPPTVQRQPNDQRPRLAESTRAMSCKQIESDVQNRAWSV